MVFAVGGASPRVLVVDDDADVRDLLEMTLTREGLDVQCLDDGLAALLHLRTSAQPPVLAILDLNMPFLGGVELLRRGSLRCPVIVLSGTIEADAWVGHPSVAAVFRKPVEIARLVCEARRLCPVVAR